MGIIGVLVVVLIVLGAFKLLALVFKAGFFLISIPLQIIGAIFIALLAILFFPVGIVTGLITAIFAPLLIIGPLLPFLLIGLLIYLIVRK